MTTVLAARSPSRCVRALDQRRQSAHEIKRRQHVHKTQQIANDDLAELQPQSVGVHDAQAQQPLADGLTAPAPFAKKSVADLGGEK
jgi:hypothetical protein